QQLKGVGARWSEGAGAPAAVSSRPTHASLCPERQCAARHSFWQYHAPPHRPHARSGSPASLSPARLSQAGLAQAGLAQVRSRARASAGDEASAHASATCDDPGAIAATARTRSPPSSLPPAAHCSACLARADAATASASGSTPCRDRMSAASNCSRCGDQPGSTMAAARPPRGSRR
ncbi:hypothetical protein TSOC_010854, partial [Tetrabaena socialis]